MHPYVVAFALLSTTEMGALTGLSGLRFTGSAAAELSVAPNVGVPVVVANCSVTSAPSRTYLIVAFPVMEPLSGIDTTPVS